MKLNKTTRRLLLLNLFLSTITHSMALKCFTKAVFSIDDGSDETWPLNGADTNDCADGETRCITVTGSFMSGENIAGTPMISMYKVKMLRKCASTGLCGVEIGEGTLAGLLKAFDETIKTDSISSGDGITSNCCEGNYCNKLADDIVPTTAPTTAPSSGYKTLKSICFSVAMSLLIFIF